MEKDLKKIVSLRVIFRRVGVKRKFRWMLFIIDECIYSTYVSRVWLRSSNCLKWRRGKLRCLLLNVNYDYVKVSNWNEEPESIRECYFRRRLMYIWWWLVEYWELGCSNLPLPHHPSWLNMFCFIKASTYSVVPTITLRVLL